MDECKDTEYPTMKNIYTKGIVKDDDEDNETDESYHYIVTSRKE